MIAHHPSITVFWVEAATVAVIVVTIGAVWLRERQRRRAGRVARMREPD